MTKKVLITITTLAFLTAGAHFAAADQHMKDMMGSFRKTVGDTTVEVKLDPAHPMAKMRTKAAIEFSDAKTKKAVKVSDVEVRWAMPEMGHDVETKRAVPGRSDGSFTSTIKLPMEGKYTATVTAKRDGKPIEATFALHAMGGSSGDGKHMH